jgi:hypothetical protein
MVRRTVLALWESERHLRGTLIMSAAAPRGGNEKGCSPKGPKRDHDHRLRLFAFATGSLHGVAVVSAGPLRVASLGAARLDKGPLHCGARLLPERDSVVSDCQSCHTCRIELVELGVHCP